MDNELNGKAVLTSKALAGYLETASGRPLVLAIFVNNVMLDAPRPKRTVSEATAEAGRLLGKLCEVFYASDGEGTPAAELCSEPGGSCEIQHRTAALNIAGSATDPPARLTSSLGNRDGDMNLRAGIEDSATCGAGGTTAGRVEAGRLPNWRPLAAARALA